MKEKRAHVATFLQASGEPLHIVQRGACSSFRYPLRLVSGSVGDRNPWFHLSAATAEMGSGESFKFRSEDRI